MAINCSFVCNVRKPCLTSDVIHVKLLFNNFYGAGNCALISTHAHRQCAGLRSPLESEFLSVTLWYLGIKVQARV